MSLQNFQKTRTHHQGFVCIVCFPDTAQLRNDSTRLLSTGQFQFIHLCFSVMFLQGSIAILVFTQVWSFFWFIVYGSGFRSHLERDLTGVPIRWWRIFFSFCATYPILGYASVDFFSKKNFFLVNCRTGLSSRCAVRYLHFIILLKHV